jgi:hypothetical protein
MEKIKIIKSCPGGCTEDDLIQMGIDLNHFLNWMKGKTYSRCDGVKYDPMTKKYNPSECNKNPHGKYFYVWNVSKYLEISKNEKRISHE